MMNNPESHSAEPLRPVTPESPRPTEKPPAAEREEDHCIQIFTVSAVMVGVCLTVIGLFRVIAELKAYGGIGDDLLALDALAFLGSCLMSYYTLRTRKNGRNIGIERTADLIFLFALSLMAVICFLIAYAVI